MKLKNIVITVSFIVISSFQSSAQEGYNSLSVGDSLPIFNIPKIINSKKAIGNTKDYKNGLLIIDFWGTSCSICVEKLPEMVSLERKMGSNVSILPVTAQSEDVIRTFLKNNRHTKNVNIPTVVEDKIFGSYFKHRYFPHEVWIYHGKVIGITGINYVDEYNIRRVLAGEIVNWPVKYDYYKYDFNTPLFTLDPRQVDTVQGKIQYSIIGSSRKNVDRFSGVSRNPLKKTIRAFIQNQSVLNSYLIHLSNIVKSNELIKPTREYQENMILWEVKNKSRYVFEKGEGNYLEDWILRNGICFESVYFDKGQTSTDISESVILDLNRLFGLNVRWEKRREKVWVITKKREKVDNINVKVLSKGKKYLLYEIFFKLNQIAENPYVFNESGVEDLEIPLDISSFQDIFGIRLCLERSGFEMKEQEREVDKLVFSEINGGIFYDHQNKEKVNTLKNNGATSSINR